MALIFLSPAHHQPWSHTTLPADAQEKPTKPRHHPSEYHLFATAPTGPTRAGLRCRGRWPLPRRNTIYGINPTFSSSNDGTVLLPARKAASKTMQSSSTGCSSYSTRVTGETLSGSGWCYISTLLGIEGI